MSKAVKLNPAQFARYKAAKAKGYIIEQTFRLNKGVKMVSGYQARKEGEETKKTTNLQTLFTLLKV